MWIIVHFSANPKKTNEKRKCSIILLCCYFIVSKLFKTYFPINYDWTENSIFTHRHFHTTNVLTNVSSKRGFLHVAENLFFFSDENRILQKLEDTDSILSFQATVACCSFERDKSVKIPIKVFWHLSAPRQKQFKWKAFKSFFA